MALTGITLDTATILAMGLIVVTAYAAIWVVRKVISLAKA
jgi:hypothetical protein